MVRMGGRESRARKGKQSLFNPRAEDVNASFNASDVTSWNGGRD